MFTFTETNSIHSFKNKLTFTVMLQSATMAVRRNIPEKFLKNHTHTHTNSQEKESEFARETCYEISKSQE